MVAHLNYTDTFSSMTLTLRATHHLLDMFTNDGNSADKLRHTESVAYSAEQVLPNKHQFSGGGVCLHCYPMTIMNSR